MGKNGSLVRVIGGGLAGVEAANFLLERGVQVILHEMRPQRSSAAHKTNDLAELVCSNSFKSQAPNTAAGVLKAEMRALDSLVLAAAEKSKVPSGDALSVDRVKFSEAITENLQQFENFELVRGEVSEVPPLSELTQKDETWIVASGPLTSDALFSDLRNLCPDEEVLCFYDSVAPVVDFDSLDPTKMFWGNRNQEGADYLNIPLSKDQYYRFVNDVLFAEKVPLHSFEKINYFESCLPIEVLAERGKETLRFGPMKPVGFKNQDGLPYAVVQLRKENLSGSMLSMVGFQTKLKWGEQKRVFSSLPGFERVEFFRLGSIHRNSYFKSPQVLSSNLAFRNNNRVFLAGQLTGVEGYLESACMGICAAANVFNSLSRGESSQSFRPPLGTMIRALIDYVTKGGFGDFSPMNANFGLLPPFEAKIEKTAKRAAFAERSRGLSGWYSCLT